jgi:flagellin-like protein
MTTKKSMKKDEQAVSPVIAVIMLIAITVVIAAVVAAFAYGIIGGVKKAPNCALVVDGAVSSTQALNVTMIHHGGDTIVEAFGVNATDTPTGELWNKLEVRYNGAVFNNIAYLNGASNATGWADGNFKAGDELKLSFPDGLDSGDSLTVVFKPTGDVLQRITVT